MLKYIYLLEILALEIIFCFNIFVYVPEYKNKQTVDWKEVSQYATHLIFYSIWLDHNGNILSKENVPPPEHEIRKNLTSVKTMVCLGTEKEHGGVFEVVRDKGKAKFAVENIMQYIKEMQVDGIDINMEMPREEEHLRNYELFIKLLKLELNRNNKILSVALHIGPNQLIPKFIGDNSDFLHLLAYDNWCSFPEQLPPCKHSDYEFARRAIDQTISVPHLYVDKVTLGIPFYGRNKFTGAVIGYGDIIRNQDISADQDEIDEVYFNNKNTVLKKVQLAFRRGLGGVMIWELGKDSFPLSSSKSLLPSVASMANRLIKYSEL